MANEFEIKIGTFNLDGSNNVAVSDIEAQVNKSIQRFALPKFDGSVIPIGKRSSITLNIKGTLVGSNYDDTRQKLDNLISAFESLAEQKFTMDDDRFIKVQAANFAYSFRAVRTFVDFSVSLVASSPFWYSETLNSNNTLTDLNPSVAMTNNGNARTRCKITVTAGASPIADDLKLENQTAGVTLQYRGTIVAGDSLVINNRVDQEDFTVLNDGVDDLVNFEGDLPVMDAGSNTWVLTTAVSDVTVTIEWRDAYQ